MISLPPFALPPLTVESCGVSFHNDTRMVLLDIRDHRKIEVILRMPEYMMADVVGHFMRERLFGLH